MNQIKIKSLRLINFKGIRNLKIDNLQDVNHIFGDNATGKTTVFDAFTWLLFGKDSSDRTAFEIKTLDRFNNPIPKIDHEVEAVIDVNGEEVKITRTLKEKWVTRRGSSDAEFAGNETLYQWNDVPLLAGEFSKKISGILDEKVFKLITNPLAFNSLKWQDRRQVLIDMAGGVTDHEIAEGNVAFKELLDKLSNKSMEEYQKQIAASLRKMKADIKAIPTRIDEVERSKPEALNFDELRGHLDKALQEVEDYNAKLRDLSKADQEVVNKKRIIRSDINEIEDHIIKIKRELRLKAREKATNTDKQQLQSQHKTIQAELEQANKALDNMKAQKAAKEREVAHLKELNSHLQEDWKKKSAESFTMSEADTTCPTCKRELEDAEAKREELERNFNAEKREKLESINLRGQNNTQTIKALKEEIEIVDKRIDKGREYVRELEDKDAVLAGKIESFEDGLSEEDIYHDLLKADTHIPEQRAAVDKLEKEFEGLKTADTSELEEARKKAQAFVNELQVKLRDEAQIKAADNRIEELRDEERAIAQEIANQEREQFTIENFIKAKIEALEERINARFEMVSFKMYATQINGGEVETCETLIDGVPFSDANNAAKINAGIDIINTLTDYYGVNAPIFVDNRESVVRLLPTSSQIINLVVSENDKTLRVEVGQFVAVEV